MYGIQGADLHPGRSHRKQTFPVTLILGSLLGVDHGQREARSQQVNGAPDGYLPHPAGISTDSQDRVSYDPLGSLPSEYRRGQAQLRLRNETWLRLVCRGWQSPKINTID